MPDVRPRTQHNCSTNRSAPVTICPVLSPSLGSQVLASRAESAPGELVPRGLHCRGPPAAHRRLTNGCLLHPHILGVSFTASADATSSELAVSHYVTVLTVLMVLTVQMMLTHPSALACRAVICAGVTFVDTVIKLQLLQPLSHTSALTHLSTFAR